MKNIYFLFLMGVAAWGCGDKDRYMMTQLPTEAVLNPETRAIIKDNILINVKLEDANSVRGFTNKNVFATTNDFTAFTYNAYTLPDKKITPYDYRGTNAVVVSGTVTAPLVHTSYDNGASWKTNAPVFSPALSTAGFNSTEIICASFIDSNNVMLTYQQKADAAADSRKYYRLNLTTNIATRISYFDDTYQPLSVKFADYRTGWCLLYRLPTYSTYISKTLDTGRTWSSPKLIDKKVIANLELGEKGNVTAREDYGTIYISTDSGSTWKTPATALSLTDSRMANRAVIYGLTKESIVKSTDTGVTWNTASNSILYEFGNMQKLHFKDDQNGVMYGGQKLYKTNDGGSSWKVLLYPYSYVIE